MPREKRTCCICGKEFMPKNVQNIVCSSECKRRRENQRSRKYREKQPKKQYAERPCEICGKTFKPLNCKQRTCGAGKCTQRWRKRRDPLYSAENPGVTEDTAYLIDRFMREDRYSFKEACKAVGRGKFADVVEQELNKLAIYVHPHGLEKGEAWKNNAM